MSPVSSDVNTWHYTQITSNMLLKAVNVWQLYLKGKNIFLHCDKQSRYEKMYCFSVNVLHCIILVWLNADVDLFIIFKHALNYLDKIKH